MSQVNQARIEQGIPTFKAQQVCFSKQPTQLQKVELQPQLTDLCKVRFTSHLYIIIYL